MIRTNDRRGEEPHAAARGFTLIEALVVLFVVAILTSLILAGVFGARESARRLVCAQNLHQIGIALQSYCGAYGVFPPGYQAGLGSSFLVAILPYAEQTTLYNLIQSGGIGTARTLRLGMYSCPSDGAGTHLPLGTTNYAGNQGTGVQQYGYNGAFALDAVVAPSQITDGLSTTSAASEWLVGPLHGMIRDPRRSTFHTSKSWIKPVELDLFAANCRSLDPLTAQLAPVTVGTVWTHGDFGHTLYNHILAVGQNTCENGSKVQLGAWTAKSNHSGGVNVLFADGDVRFLSSSISPATWAAIGSRNGGELTSGPY